MTYLVFKPIQKITLFFAFSLILLAFCSRGLQAAVPAFPGAEGAGAYASGGRGGKVYRVTNLNDSGPGSLREAVQAVGKRIVIFDVAGIISLQSTLKISNGDITIAGQTAPGKGICLRNHPLQVAADNVIIRFIRSRMGEEAGVEGDAIWGRYQQDIIIDHCSFSWSVDECASFYANKNMTMQWCTICESLNMSVHVKENHGYGGIWGGSPASFHHNLIVHHSSRTPRLSGGDPATEMVDVRNNVFYNWGPTNGGYGGTGGSYNFVGNYYKPGPSTAVKDFLCNRIMYTGPSEEPDSTGKYIWGIFHFDDNYFDDGCPDLSETAINNCALVNANNYLGLHLSTSANLPGGTKYGIQSSTPFACAAVSTHQAWDAYDKVLELAGASKQRDKQDQRYVAELIDGIYSYEGSRGSTNGIIDSQNDVGGWDTYSGWNNENDSDGDGMPDNWEDIHGLEPVDPSDGVAYTLSQQYTNIEVYLNSLVEAIMAAGLEGAESNLRPVHNPGVVPQYLWTETGLLVPDAVGMELYTMAGLLLKKVDDNIMDIDPVPGLYLLRVMDSASRVHTIRLLK
ncbi:MAG: pectate lyase [Bacteroidales bacterium]|nr:pectate lyase [Bacteroidales bacterium]MDD4430799.1 pectate lyase [Bacteroidales bacterium]